MFQIKRVETKSDWDEFIGLPWTIYKNDTYWVPPLRIAVKDLLDVNKNPFFQHASLYPLIAYKNGKCVGRIVGVIDENHNQFHEEKMGFFGFFEAIEDQSLANLMLDEVAKWVKSKGMTTLRGPVNPSMNHECGLLVEGFQDAPQVMMTYNPEYYARLFEKWGLAKSKDLYAYMIDGLRTKFSDRLIAHSERLKKRGSVKIRAMQMSQFDQEVERILEIYNDAWEKNWGFVPWTPEEFRHTAKDMKMIVDPELCFIAEVRGQTAGFGLALPDVNQVFKKVPDGKLLPTGILKLLWYLKGPARKRTINRCRIITVGLKKAFQEYGIGPLIYTEYLRKAPALGYIRGEASWILEDNGPMNKALEQMCGEKTKVYRLYDRVLT